MGKQSRRKKTRSRRHPDTGALDRIATPGGIALVEGEDVPIVIPRAEPACHMGFDSAVCAAGLVKFLRPRMASEQPNPAHVIAGGETPIPQFHSSHVMVEI